MRPLDELRRLPGKPRVHALNHCNSTDEERQHDARRTERGRTHRSGIRAPPRYNVMLYNNQCVRESSVTRLRRSPAAADLAGLDQHVGYMLRQAQLAVFADFISSQRGAVARPGQFSILALIGSNPGLSQTQVCSALGIKRANLV